MKRFLIRFSLLLAAVTFIILQSCSKDDDDNGGGDPPSSNFSAKVDGDAFSAVQYAATVDENHNLIVGGVNNQGSTIVLSLADFNGEGSFSLTPNSESGAIYTPDTNNVLNTFTTFGENGSGTAVITGWNATDSIISGTFSFNAQHISNSSTVSVSDGVFSSIQVEFEKENGGTDPTDNSFSVKIDGILWEHSGSSIAGSSSGGVLTILAINVSDGTSFIVTMPADAPLGTHEFDIDQGYNIIYSDGSPPGYIATLGSITIATHDQVGNHIEATFSFTGDDGTSTKIFTDGEINSNYQ